MTAAAVDVRRRIGRNGLLSNPVPAPSYFLLPWSYELDQNLRKPGQWTFEIKINSSLGETVLEVPLEVAGQAGQQTAGPQRGGIGIFGSNGPN